MSVILTSGNSSHSSIITTLLAFKIIPLLPCEIHKKTNLLDNNVLHRKTLDYGGLELGIMKTAAVKGLIPAGNKVSELRSNLMRLITEMSLVLEERYGPEGLETVAEIFRRLGEQDALLMKERLGLGDTLNDSVDAWVVIGHVMGSKMDVTWESENRAVANHPHCPQYDEFKKHGTIYCDSACLPYVGAVAEKIAPGVKMNLVRPADMSRTCTKALVYKSSDVA